MCYCPRERRQHLPRRFFTKIWLRGQKVYAPDVLIHGEQIRRLVALIDQEQQQIDALFERYHRLFAPSEG